MTTSSERVACALTNQRSSDCAGPLRQPGTASCPRFGRQPCCVATVDRELALRSSRRNFRRHARERPMLVSDTNRPDSMLSHNSRDMRSADLLSRLAEIQESPSASANPADRRVRLSHHSQESRILDRWREFGTMKSCVEATLSDFWDLPLRLDRKAMPSLHGIGGFCSHFYCKAPRGLFSVCLARMRCAEARSAGAAALLSD